MCVIWVGLDVFLSTASILHLCAIAIHRHKAIVYPMHFRQGNFRRQIFWLLVPPWTISFLIAVPLAFNGSFKVEYVLINSPDGPQCGIFDPDFAIYSPLVSFFIPLLVMILVDTWSVIVLRTNAQKVAPRRGAAITQVQTVSVDLPSPSTEETSLAGDQDDGPSSNGSLKRNKNHKSVKIKKKTEKEKKAEQALLIVFAVFVIMWLPFFILMEVSGICRSCEIKAVLMTAFTWLGYISSGVNPCVYALLNRDFREAYRKLLFCERRG